jgi:putative acetyltransferase
MQIKIDDLRGPEIALLLEEHLAGMRASSPACSVHALDIDALRKPEITFWSAWEDGELLGCGALKELNPQHAEVKSMRTSAKHLRKKVASRILQVLIDTATSRGYKKLSLETGAQPAFVPARTMYESFGFTYCAPFESYWDDPNSVFMEKIIGDGVEFKKA